MRTTTISLLLLAEAASLRLPPVPVESRRSVLRAAGLLLPLSLPTASHAGLFSADGTPDPSDDLGGFKREKAAALKAAKKAEEKQAAADEAAGAKAAAALEAKAKKTKAPLTFEEMVRNSIAQYQAETGMTMSEEEIEKLRAKLKKSFPGVA